MSALPSKDMPCNIEDIAQFNKRLQVELVAFKDAERHWVEETAICAKVMKRKKNMKGGSTSSKNATKVARDHAGKLIEKTRNSVLSEHTGSPSHEDSISSIHHLASEEIQNMENNLSSPSREHLEIIHSSALGEELREHSPVCHSALGRSQNGDNDSSLCLREQLESHIHNSASRRGSQSQQLDLANELPGSKATMEALGDNLSGDSQQLDTPTATTEVKINAVKAMVEACATILSDSLNCLAAGPNSKPEAEASSSLDDLQQELKLEEKAQEIDRELVCQIEALQNARSKLNEAYKSCGQWNLLIHKKQACRCMCKAMRTKVEKLERVLHLLLLKRKRTEDAETKGQKKTKGEPAKPNEQSKWEEMEDKDKNELKGGFFFLGSSLNWPPRSIMAVQRSGKAHIQQIAKGSGMYIDGMRAMVEGIAFKQNTAAEPPARFLLCKLHVHSMYTS
ncbi:hypothetical protein BDQ12DRAFT_669438 [Crucibulum laeve]|uniref:Uncharacterized protein n=1 Tax=Crucibulum laeve TaxID=68775 RepID=A0A5C3LPW9_9AGAR|nr:hypothetical protein BDQ12DRAFT_669438 [Crucibulum laeve]